MSRLLPRERLVDAALGAVALAFGSLSLTYPFGADQALYAYVAREWVEHGAIPYRDLFDHKTPGIYVVHAIACVLFGETTWGIRLLDLCAVVATGLVVADIATPRGQRVRAGVRGLACVVMAVLHYGYFDYWNTCQSEVWYSLLALISLRQATRVESESRAAASSGFLAGLTLLMKPPGAWLLLVTVATLGARIWKRPGDRARRLAIVAFSFVGLATVPIGVTLAYFAAHDAIEPMRDIVVGANGFYVKHDHVRSFALALSLIRDVCKTTFPLVPAIAGASAWQAYRAWKAGRRDCVRAHIVAAATVVAALAAVFMQMKLYWLHWMVVCGPMTLVVACAAHDWLSEPTIVFGAKGSLRAVAAAAGVVFLFAIDLSPSTYWLDQQSYGFRRITGQVDRETFDSFFEIRPFYYFYRDMDDVARFIETTTTPDEQILVRGFNPEIYILSHRRYGGRFFWTNFLNGPERAYRRADYLAEDEHAFETIRPRYAVALTGFEEGLDSPSWFLARGYRIRETIGAFVVLEPEPVVH